MLAIEVQGLKKSFGKKEVLKGINLKVEKGTIHAILGPNGSGKSTFVKILSTLLQADEGKTFVAGYDVNKEPDKVRESIQLTGQNASVDDDLTGYENLYLISRLLGYNSTGARRRSIELLEAFNLAPSSNKLVKTYSGGMRRKLDIAASIISTPEVLFLDEPTTGLDPRSRNDLWAIIRRLALQGTTILLTTQYLEEAEQLADKISVIDNGVVISEGTSDELKASVGSNVLHVSLYTLKENTRLHSFLQSRSFPETLIDAESKRISFPVSDQKEAIRILEELKDIQLDIKGFSLSAPDLNEVFLALTGKPTEPSSEEDAQQNQQEPHSLSPFINPLIDHARPFRNPGIVSNKLMFGWRNLIKIKHIPEQFMDVLVTPIMFTFMFTYLFGGALAGSVQEYLQFLIPGILVQTLTFNASYAGINISNDITKGIFDRFKSMPIWLPAPLAGIFIGDFLRHLLSGLLVLLFAFILGYRADAGIAAFSLSFIIMIIFALSLSWFFIIMGLTMRSTSAVMSLGWFILMPLVFMSNIFVDPSTMPQWLQNFIAYNPVAWQVDAVRGLLSGVPSYGIIVSAIGASVVITMVLFPLAVFFYKRER